MRENRKALNQFGAFQKSKSKHIFKGIKYMTHNIEEFTQNELLSAVTTAYLFGHKHGQDQLSNLIERVNKGLWKSFQSNPGSQSQIDEAKGHSTAAAWVNIATEQLIIRPTQIEEDVFRIIADLKADKLRQRSAETA